MQRRVLFFGGEPGQPFPRVGLPRAMQVQDHFQEHVRLALARYGVEVDEIDIQVITAAEAVYGHLRDALMAADLSHVEAEPWIDPSQPPAPPVSGGGTQAG